MKPVDFHASFEFEGETGDLMAVYFQVRKGKVSQTREVGDGAAFADYGKKGELLGIELLAPCRIQILDQVIDQPLVRKFVSRNIPRNKAWAPVP